MSILDTAPHPARVLTSLREAFRDWRDGPQEVSPCLTGRILIASIPRCGSTLLVRALTGFPPGERLPRHKQIRFTHDLSSLPGASIIKTHGTAPGRLPDDVKAVFLFGDPVLAVASTLRKRFDRKHFRNCGYTASRPPDIIGRDDLGYERIWDTWTAPHPYSVLHVRFESLWQHKNAIEEYIGSPVDLPPFRARQTRLDPSLRQELEATYQPLIGKIRHVPDLYIATARDD